MTVDDAARWAVGWLQSHAGWLLVLDNVEDPAHTDSLLAALSGGDVLVTSRRSECWAAHQVPEIPLHTLARPASVRLLEHLLLDRPAAFDPQAADLLAGELGDLPLALTQVAAYIRAQHTTIAAYLDLLATAPGAVLDAVAPGTDAQRAVARVFDLSAHALKKTNPEAIEVLAALAFIAPDDYPRTAIAPTPPGKPAAARFEVNQALAALASYSLITLTPETVSVHRLVQTITRTQHPDARGVALDWLLNARPDGSAQDTTGWPMWAALLPHIETLVEYLPDNTGPRLAALLGEGGMYCWAQGRYRNAEALEWRALRITEATLGPDHPTTATRVDNLAFSLEALRRHEEALSLQQRALRITRRG